jgi:hypothetical protein
MRRVLSAEAEDATALLRSTVAQHVAVERTLLRAPGFPRGRLAAISAGGQRRQATLTRLVSITEAFLARRLIDRAESRVVPTADSIREAVWAKAEDTATGSWVNLASHYNTWLGVPLSRSDDFKRILVHVEARNAVAHGVGELTRRQRRRGEALTRSLSDEGYLLVGSRVEVSEAVLRAASSLAVRVVSFVDGAT